MKFLGGGNELIVLLAEPLTRLAVPFIPVLGEDASAVSQQGTGSTQVESHKSVGGIVAIEMDTAGYQRFSGLSKESRGTTAYRRRLDPDECVVRLRADPY